MFEIIQIPVLPHNANYNYILHGGGETIVFDPSLAVPVIEILDEKGWQLDRIINTHHHWDHTDGNLELKEHYGAQVVGFSGDARRIPGIDVQVNDGDEIEICGEVAKVMFLPGHTLGHIAYYFEKSGMIFSGDVLFSMGCGRIFEGTYEQAYESLQKLAGLPPETKVYCAHEYTAANGKFALTIEPDNQALLARMDEVACLRAKDLPTVPVTIGMELATNPFLRAENVEEFAEIRKKKDVF